MSTLRLPLALAAAVLTCSCLSARADDAPASSSSADAHSASPFDFGVAAGTAGLGAQVSWQAIPGALAIRAVANTLSITHSTTSDDVDYKGKLKLNNQWLLLDWAPFSGRFRFSGGLVFNHNSLRLDGQPSGSNGTYVVNGQSFQLSSLDAQVSFRKTAPYIGLGWGSTEAGGLHFIGDIGAIAQGKPTVKLTATGQDAAAAQSSLQQSQADLQSDLNSFRWYPVVQLGLGYRF